VKINFDCSDEEGAFYQRLSDITGMSKAEIFRRAVKFYSKQSLSVIFGEEVKKLIVKTYGKARF